MKCTFENIINNPNASVDDFELNMGFVIDISSVGVACSHTELTMSSELVLNHGMHDINKAVSKSPIYEQLINKIKSVRLPVGMNHMATIEDVINKVKKMGYDITHAMIIDYNQTPPTITERCVL